MDLISRPTMALLEILILLVLAGVTPAQEVPAPPPRTLESEHLEGLRWRSIGPASMGGRITDLAVVGSDPRIFYVGAASGGLWKTTNGGTTFEPVFNDAGTSSVGAVAVAPGDSNVVWVGTGEANPRNSVTWGDGVYRTVDGGKTWEHCGLRETRHIGRVAIDPRDPAVVYVAALGRIWGANSERGLYRTRNAGETWDHVLALDDGTGCVDVVIDPKSPDTVYAVAYRVRRDGFDGNDPEIRWGDAAGIYKSTDAGDSWKRLINGLPTVACGRIGLAIYAEDPRILYATVETRLTGKHVDGSTGGRAYMGVQGADGDGGASLERVLPDTSAAEAGLLPGDLIISSNGDTIRGWQDLVDAIRVNRAGDTVTLGFMRQGDFGEAEITFGGHGLTVRMGGQRANAQEEQGPRGHETGGIFRSEDGGETWSRVNSLQSRPFYFGQIRIDPTDHRTIWLLGIQMHVSTDGGQSFRGLRLRGVHADHHALWIDPANPKHLLLGGDGGIYLSWSGGRTWQHLRNLAIGQYYAAAVDMRRPYMVYGGLQDNGTWGTPSRTRDRSGLSADHPFRIGGGDGFVCAVEPGNDHIVYCESQGGAIRRVNVATGKTARVFRPRRSDVDLRWHWKTPFLISPHNPTTLFYAANRLFRSVDRGATAVMFDTELVLTERGAVTALALDMHDERIIWAGSDDGGLFVTKDGGLTWTELQDRLTGVGQPRHVACITSSRTRKGEAWIVLDGHRSDDLRPLVFHTSDGGATFRSLSLGLPETSVRVLTEDPHRSSLLYLGTETGVWVSVNAGGRWIPWRGGLPTVPIHDLVVHPRDGELIAATHGRGLWVVDVTPLQSFRDPQVEAASHLFTPKIATDWIRTSARSRFGKRRYTAKNPRPGALITYWIGVAREDGVALEIHDLMGEKVHTLDGPGEVGLHTVTWDLKARSGESRRRRKHLGPGTYKVKLIAGDEEQEAPLLVTPDPLMEQESNR